MIAYDYARRGDTVTGVYTNQVAAEFLPTVERKPAWVSWTPSDLRHLQLCMASSSSNRQFSMASSSNAQHTNLLQSM